MNQHPSLVVRARCRACTTARDQRGTTTAETMMVLPLLAVFCLGLVWLLALAATQMRVVDSAREVARAAARNDSAQQAVALGRRVAPADARITLRSDRSTITARVDAEVRGPAGLFAFLPAVHVSATAVSAKESP